MTTPGVKHTLEPMKVWQQSLLVIGTGVTTGVLTAYLTSRVVGSQIEKAFEPPPYRVSGPLVSAIIPTLEEEGYLPQLLETIANQTYEPIEVVVGDSSPPDSAAKTREICQAYGAKYVYVPQLNVSRGRNAGAVEARGEALVFIDADVLLSPTYIEAVVEALQQGAVLAHGADMVGEKSLFSTASVILRGWLKPSAHTTGRGIAIWRDAFWEVGGYDEALDPITGVREDLDLGRKVRETFGPGAIKLLRTAWVVESPRRINLLGAGSWWKTRGVRDGRVIPL